MIRIRLSEDALADLDDGFWFYEWQETGLGDYFSTCLRGDIEGLKTTAGVHRRYIGTTIDCSAAFSHLQSTTPLLRKE